MKKYILNYIESNFKMIYVLLICLIVGAIIGIITFNFIDDGVKKELTDTFIKTLDITKKADFQGINVIKNGVISNTLLLFLIYFCALTIVCPILIFIIDFIKGFAIGIYIPTIFCVFGFGNGLLVLLLLVILPNLIYVPALIYSFCSSLNFNYNILNSKEKSFLQIFLKEIINLVFIISIILLSVVVEQLLSTFVISIYQNLA